jgi:hypothetical protein
MFPKVGLLQETKGGGKEKWQRINNNKINHICVGTRHKKTAEWYRVEGKGEK